MPCGSAIPEQTDDTLLPGTPDRPSLADVVRSALTKTGHGWLQRVVVVTEGEVVVLQGKVPSYYLKQMAQVTVMTVPGVEALRNELEVEGGRR
jgi:osmotically-inducible protein OsmY